MADAERNDKYFLTTLEKGLNILSLFGRESSTFSARDISRRMDISLTSAYRFTGTLSKMGYLVKNQATRSFSLGPQALRQAHGFLEGHDLLHALRPVVDSTFEKLGVSMDVALVQGGSLLIIYRRDSEDTLFFRLPTVVDEVHSSAVGKAALAFMSRRRAARLTVGDLRRRTENTLTAPATLAADLEKTRQRGFSVCDQEFAPGLISIGAPIFTARTGRVVGGVSFDFSTAQMTVAEMTGEYSGRIVSLAGEITGTTPVH